MATSVSHVETEIKLRVPGATVARALLEQHGYTIVRPRVFESNTIHDTPDQALRHRGDLVRVRRAGANAILTFKSADMPGRHKRREEIETQVADAGVVEAILERLGLPAAFRYEKFRAEYQASGSDGIVTLDETPIGTFFELEGPAAWIDETARQMGFSEADYILSSYGALYFEYCRDHDIEPGNMVFPTSPNAS